MKRWKSSSWISLLIILLIPMSWVVQFFLNQWTMKYLIKTFKNMTPEDFNNFQILFLSIPISQLVVLATIVIPAIFLRKAARETSTNLTLPIGKNALNILDDE